MQELYIVREADARHSLPPLAYDRDRTYTARSFAPSLSPTAPRMKALLLFAAAALGAAPALAQSPSTSPEDASWMRYPAISPDGKTIPFTFNGDLYKVSSTGGAARTADALGLSTATSAGASALITAGAGRSRPVSMMTARTSGSRALNS